MKTHKKPPVNWGALQNTTQKTKDWATWKPTKNLQWTEVLSGLEVPTLLVAPVVW
jgi:hypothetical protein